jgi:hypothetical protein
MSTQGSAGARPIGVVSHVDLSLSGDVEQAGKAQKRKPAVQPIRPIAPFSLDPREAAKACFDRETGLPLMPHQLKTYAQALSAYHLRPESKFENGDFYDRGPTRRRHVRAIRVEYIGKESNRWEEQYHLGPDEGADIPYGANPNAQSSHVSELKSLIDEFGERSVALQLGISRNTLRRMIGENSRTPSPSTLRRIAAAAHALGIFAVFVLL